MEIFHLSISPEDLCFLLSSDPCFTLCLGSCHALRPPDLKTPTTRASCDQFASLTPYHLPSPQPSSLYCLSSVNFLDFCVKNFCHFSFTSVLKCTLHISLLTDVLQTRRDLIEVESKLLISNIKSCWRIFFLFWKS